MKETVLRPGDMVARYGGEEFAIILENTPLEAAKQIAESIRQKIFDLHLENRQSTVSQYLTISIGVATIIPQQDDDVSILVEKADKALYSAKSAGRNRVYGI